jgi:endonuclease-3
VFALGVPAIPVDTHVHRIARRSAMIGPRVSADQAHGLLEAELAPQQALAVHLNLIRHGKTVCRALRPACDRCPLAAYCPRHGVGP